MSQPLETFDSRQAGDKVLGGCEWAKTAVTVWSVARKWIILSCQFLSTARQTLLILISLDISLIKGNNYKNLWAELNNHLNWIKSIIFIPTKSFLGFPLITF